MRAAQRSRDPAVPSAARAAACADPSGAAEGAREVWTLSVGPDASVDATLVPSEHPDRKTMTWVESLSRYGTLKRLYRVETRDGAERVSPRPYTDEYKVRGVDNAEVKAFHHGDVFDGVW